MRACRRVVSGTRPVLAASRPTITSACFDRDQNLLDGRGSAATAWPTGSFLFNFPSVSPSTRRVPLRWWRFIWRQSLRSGGTDTGVAAANEVESAVDVASASSCFRQRKVTGV